MGIERTDFSDALWREARAITRGRYPAATIGEWPDVMEGIRSARPPFMGDVELRVRVLSYVTALNGVGSDSDPEG